jgi:hypothetical protein
MKESSMRSETVPTPASPEQPPLAPYDPPEPAPQAAAWQRALRVIGCAPTGNSYRVVRATLRTVKKVKENG